MNKEILTKTEYYIAFWGSIIGSMVASTIITSTGFVILTIIFGVLFIKQFKKP